METFHIKRNDTGPRLSVRVMTDGGDTVDLTDAVNPEFHMWSKRLRTSVVDTAAEVTDGPGGVLTYDWDAADTASAGIFEGEFKVELATGEVITAPNDGHIPIVITEDIS